MVKKYLATRGLGAVLKKAKPSYPKAKPRGTPTKAGLVARRAALRGETLAEQARGVIPKGVKAPKKKPIISKDEIKGGLKGAALTYAFLKLKESGKTKKEAKAKGRKKLKEATEKHEKKTKEKRKKYGKHQD